MAALAAESGGQSFELVGLDPPVQLAEYLLPPLKRARVPFDAAWELALSRVAWPSSAREQREWLSQLAATRTAWMAAYEDEPATREELMAGSLADSLSAACEFSELVDAAT